MAQGLELASPNNQGNYSTYLVDQLVGARSALLGNTPAKLGIQPDTGLSSVGKILRTRSWSVPFPERHRDTSRTPSGVGWGCSNVM